MSRAAWQRLLCALLLLAPGEAGACGWCTDAVLRRRFWPASLALDLVVGFGLEALGYSIFLIVLHRPTAYRRATLLFGAAIAAVGVGFFTRASGLAMASTFAVGLLVSFVRSLVADRAMGARVLAVRAVAALALTATGLWLSHPGSLATHRLVSLSLIAPDAWGTAAQGWCDRELVGRADARQEIERRLAEIKGPLARSQDVELLRLHRLVGGELVERRAACAALQAQGPVEPAVVTTHQNPGPPPGELRSLCRPAAL